MSGVERLLGRLELHAVGGDEGMTAKRVSSMADACTRRLRSPPPPCPHQPCGRNTKVRSARRGASAYTSSGDALARRAGHDRGAKIEPLQRRLLDPWIGLRPATRRMARRLGLPRGRRRTGGAPRGATTAVGGVRPWPKARPQASRPPATNRIRVLGRVKKAAVIVERAWVRSSAPKISCIQPMIGMP